MTSPGSQQSANALSNFCSDVGFGLSQANVGSRLKELFLLLVRQRRRWRVSGTSMEPTFADGALVLIEPVGGGLFGERRFVGKRFGGSSPIAAGDVVIARHPFKNLDVIKFVDHVHDDDHLTLRSPSGDDSRQFGRVPLGSVKGRVTTRLSPYGIQPWENAS